ncbi:MAG: hypothetical protein KIT02_14235 [Devosia sp.]|uniref:hypothetical protein n=1 Tax=Devosia sp. TaxID=1871048 RepID=UPI0024CDF31A|nr:hypothetical protein [Devosia sp.]UYN99073.1 MAG: hypothetical protein KIT02_14235 [Devosia sp.]
MQENSISRAERLRPIVIEVGGEPQGVVVQDTEGYRFVAVKLPAFGVDGHHFDSIEIAHEAVAQAVLGGDAA